MGSEEAKKLGLFLRYDEGDELRIWDDPSDPRIWVERRRESVVIEIVCGQDGPVCVKHKGKLEDALRAHRGT